MKGKKPWFKQFNAKSVALVIIALGVLLTPLSLKLLRVKGTLFYERVQTPQETRTTLQLGADFDHLRIEGELPEETPKP